MDERFRNLWAPVASIIGAVLLVWQLIQAFLGNRSLVTALLIFFSLIAIGTAMWKFAFEKSSISGFLRYQYHWAAKVILGIDVVSVLISAVYIFTLLEIIPACCRPVTTPMPTVFTRQVFSNKYPFESTNILVEKGDILKITVLGKNPSWNCGRPEKPGPDGFPDETYSDTVYDQVNVCALIGSISATSPKVYFLVGSDTTVTAPESGMLYLGCNDSIEYSTSIPPNPPDSIGHFAGNPTDSKLDVKIVVEKQSNP